MDDRKSNAPAPPVGAGGSTGDPSRASEAPPEETAARAADTNRKQSRGNRRRGFHRTGNARRSVRRAVDLSKIVRVVSDLPVDGRDAAERNRRLLAELCKVVGAHLSGSGKVGEELNLPQRLRQTLQGLVRGDNEKQIAFGLGISQHTVHVYVKQLYKRLNVTSRGELMARFMRGT